jgi:signal transduction histidine kinase
MELGQRKRYFDRTVVFAEADPGDALYIVCEGRVAVLKEKGDGRTALLAYRGRGEILGEMGVVGDRPRSASVVTVGDCELLRIERSDFRLLARECPGISQAIVHVLSDRLQTADEVRTTALQEERSLTSRLERVASEAERLASLAQVRQETVDALVHDLRSPLNVIGFCLDMLAMSVDKEALAPVVEYLELSQRSVHRLFGLVDALLEAARQEDVLVPLTRQPVDVAQLLQVSADSARPAAEGRDIEIVVALPPHLPELRVDREQLERVMSNLLDNAACYTPVGGRIVIRATEQSNEVAVSVTDTGPGIPPEYREHVFDRFVRVPGVDGHRSGFGLGLYYCRRVVSAHGGRIWVEPGPGGTGSRFVFTLPSG